MNNTVLVWDLETVPDLEGFARANDLVGKSPEEIRESIGTGFPKHIYHSIVCIGALLAQRTTLGWSVTAAGAPHVGECSEKELIERFVAKVEELDPQMVTFNGCSFDLPVLRYRSMIHSISAPGLAARSYYHRFTDDAVDLCDVLSAYSPGGKSRLDEITRIMGLPGKPEGISGDRVDEFYRAGKIQEISDYCRSDVINTYRLWLRYELFRGKLGQNEFEASEADVAKHVTSVATPANLVVKIESGIIVQGPNSAVTANDQVFPSSAADAKLARPFR